MKFDDNGKIIFVKSSQKPLLWVLINRGDSNEHPQQKFYEEISKIIH